MLMVENTKRNCDSCGGYDRNLEIFVQDTVNYMGESGERILFLCVSCREALVKVLSSIPTTSNVDIFVNLRFRALSPPKE